MPSVTGGHSLWRRAAVKIENRNREFFGFWLLASGFWLLAKIKP
jgi:hypothetical protein